MSSQAVVRMSPQSNLGDIFVFAVAKVQGILL